MQGLGDLGILQGCDPICTLDQGDLGAHGIEEVGELKADGPCAEHDDLAPPEMVAELKKLFDASGSKGELEIYPGVHHGFAFPERWCYDNQAAERHWERLIALYRRNLG